MAPTWIDTPGSVLPSRFEPLDFTVSGGGSNPPGVAPGTAQPLAYSPLGAWLLDEVYNGTTVYKFHDRSGGGEYGQAFHTTVAAPDALQPGSHALGGGIVMVFPGAIFALTGALTITMRVRITNASLPHIFIQYGGQNDSETENVCYELGATAVSLTPSYFAEHDAGANIYTTSGPSLNLTLNAWHFIALRRDVAGSVTFDVDALPAVTVTRT